MPETIRIANAGGYWGDDLAQFRRQVELGPTDYVTLDFLAEVTMSILQKQRARDPRAGYARDFIAQVDETLDLLVSRNVRAITNAGGVNPRGCRDALLELAARRGIALEVAAVVGDDRMDRIGELNAAGAALEDPRQQRLELGDEVARVPGTRVFLLLLLQDAHGDFRQVVDRDVVERQRALDLTPERIRVVAPVATGVGDADRLGHAVSRREGGRGAGACPRRRTLSSHESGRR